MIGKIPLVGIFFNENYPLYLLPTEGVFKNFMARVRGVNQKAKKSCYGTRGLSLLSEMLHGKILFCVKYAGA